MGKTGQPNNRKKKFPRTIQCHTYSLGASSVLVPGVVAAVATTPLLAAVDGWRSVPVLRKTPLTLANTLTIPFLSLSAFGTGSAGWAEELMMLLVGVRATVVVVSVGEHGKEKKASLRSPTGWEMGIAKGIRCDPSKQSESLPENSFLSFSCRLWFFFSPLLLFRQW